MKREKSDQLWKTACQVLAGGVNSPVRAFKGVGGAPFFAREGKGAHLTDADGNVFIDYVLSWGPMAVGHAHPEVMAAVEEVLRKGLGFGIPTEAETQLAQKIRAHYPSMERVRFVNSGTEATMSAIRLARGYTGRDRIIKADGCYHGHSDGLLARAGSGVATLGLPDCPGVPKSVTENTLVVPYNDVEAVREIFNRVGDSVACVIIEPVAGNMGLVPPEPGYLETLRALTNATDALLIFDEVMTGFRVALGGAQQRYGVLPDITALGKVIGGGLPVGAYGGSEAIMDLLAPTGPVYQAGTLSGNPVAMAAGIATIGTLEAPGIFEGMEHRMERLCAGLREFAAHAGVPVRVAHTGTMGGMFFCEGPVRNMAEARRADTRQYTTYFHALLEAGIYMAPSQFEAFFISAAHDDAIIDETLQAAQNAFKAVARQR